MLNEVSYRCAFPLLHFFSMVIGARVLKTCPGAHEIAEHRKTKIPEPVSSTSKRGARATYHDESPRDFDPRIAYVVGLVSETSRPPIRQGGREMSASMPYETKPLRPPALFTLYAMTSFYINAKLFQSMKRAYIHDSGPFCGILIA